MNVSRVIVCLAVLAAAGPAVAESLAGYELSKLGGRYEPGHGYFGMSTPFTGADGSGITNNGIGLGVAYYGPTTVNSLTITQRKDNWDRKFIAQYDVYANGQRVGMILLEDAPEKMGLNTEYTLYEVPILGLDGVTPISVTATWLNLVLVSQHTSSGTDPQSAVKEFWFNGTPCPTSAYETNLNVGRDFLAVGNVGSGGASSHNAGDGSKVLDGNPYGGGGNSDSLFYARDLRYQPFNDAYMAGEREQSFTVFYGEDRPTIGSIGLSFLANNADRDIPKWVIISDGDGHNLRVTIDSMMCQYNRYDQGLPCDADGNVLGGDPVYFDTVFKNTASLKLTFPEWIDLEDEPGWRAKNSDNWWINTSGTSGYFGLSEFQAFAAIPEPATMSLLALGGLAVLRRKR